MPEAVDDQVHPDGALMTDQAELFTEPQRHGEPMPDQAELSTESSLHPATPLEVMVSRALDQDLEWYFAYAGLRALEGTTLGVR